MKITAEKLSSKLVRIAKKNAPVRKRTRNKKGKLAPRAVGKKGTNMYSPYPGNLKNNGINAIPNGVVFDYNKVGYIGYANLRSSKKQFIERTVEEFCQYCVGLGGRIIKR